METSRKEGILVFNTKKPYAIAISGQQEERTEIICHDINYRAEKYGFKIENLLYIIMQDLASANDNDQSTTDTESEDKMQKFFDNDSPTEAELDEFAKSIEMFIRMNRSKDITFEDFEKIFKGIRSEGLIKGADGKAITDPVWQTISRQDRTRIISIYISFFVNPFQLLMNMQA